MTPGVPDDYDAVFNMTAFEKANKEARMTHLEKPNVLPAGVGRWGHKGVQIEEVEGAVEEKKAMKWRVTNLKGDQFVVTDLQIGVTWLLGCESDGGGLRWRTENVARVERIEREWVLRWDQGSESAWAKEASVHWTHCAAEAMRFPNEGAALRYREGLYQKARQLKGDAQMRAAAQIVALMLKLEEVDVE